MRTNKIQVTATKKPMVAASEFRFEGSNERAVGHNGELNAGSKRELMNRQMEFLAASSRGETASDAVFASAEQGAKISKELVQAAFNDSEAHRVLGERMADSLYITCNRQGFARKYLTRIDVEQGAIVRFPLRTKNVTAVYSTSPTKIQAQITRDKWFTPPELQLVTRPFIPQNELNQSAGDVLQEKYVEATEAIMVGEDRLWYSQVKALIGVDNPLSIISGQLTPYTFAQVMTNVTRWGLKAPHVLMASDLYQDIIGNSDFFTAIDPVARHELLLTGELGTLYGCAITSDAYRHREHKVLDQGEFFVISDALNHGAYSDRGGLQSQPIDISIEKVPGRGWVMFESLAISVANSRSVAAGLRV
ncbi:hypothetical protein BcepSauron_082 [Burkholderia phage BcepSauron]|uniref:Major capsid protein n=2 Tax=Sarumanvirus TaxID=2843450 RepID=A0A482MMH5_9CAUD|nr:major head protein [Burkholderia phage BcepSaruman]YP_009904460.1 major head protein [Burkholderia phage BcepSauron]QBQ74462.1 hypothetical protein BcepSauron_082 [Burkholderia phage BcepSauron]QBX06495.1 hypothetical protein BcepSaruman_082 [Burkholderia phage BcepSaruman]